MFNCHVTSIWTLQDALDDTARVWDSHLIRPSKNPNVPSGRPSVMFQVPSLYRTQDFLNSVDDEDVSLCKLEYEHRTLYPCDRDVYDMCMLVMQEERIDHPSSPEDGIELFLKLREHINDALWSSSDTFVVHYGRCILPAWAEIKAQKIACGRWCHIHWIIAVKLCLCLTISVGKFIRSIEKSILLQIVRNEPTVFVKNSNFIRMHVMSRLECHVFKCSLHAKPTAKFWLVQM